MKVMCDTNIILDVLLDQEPFAEASAKVLSLFEAGRLDGDILLPPALQLFSILLVFQNN